MTMDKMDKDGFIADLVGFWRDRDCMDIDGAAIQDLLVKHGLASEGPATEEDCATDWAQEFGLELGDTVLHDHPDLVALMKERTT